MIKKTENIHFRYRRRRLSFHSGNSLSFCAGSFSLAAVLLFVLLLNLLAACTPVASSEETNSTANVSTQSYKELPEASVSTEPGTGTLRLWWQKPASYSPLLPATVPQKGIYSLLYQPLFTLSDTGYLEGVIAEDYLWSQDRLILKINLRQGIYFSDGTALDAEDVRSSILSWKNNRGWLNTDPEDNETVGDYDVPTANNDSDDSNGETTSGAEDQNSGEPESVVPEPEIDFEEEGDIDQTKEEEKTGEGDESDDRGVPDSGAEEGTESLWSSSEEIDDVSELIFLPREDAIQSISNVVAGEDSVEIHLSERCDNLPDFLNTPIIPAKNTRGTQWELPPGTGKWYCEDFQITGELKLAQTSGEREMTVLVNVYDSAASAMQGFVSGDIDLLLLSSSSWPRYGGVKDIRSRKLPNGQFAYLQLHTESGPLSSQDYYNAVMKAFLRSNLTTDMPAGGWVYSPQPEKGIHPFLPQISAVKETLEELTADASLSLLKAEPVRALLFTWPEQNYTTIIGEQIRRELRMHDIPVVREGESLMPEEETKETEDIEETSAATKTPSPTPDPNVIVLPEETISTATEATSTKPYDPTEIPTTTAVELVISSEDYPEPFLFYRYLLGTAAADESLTILKEAYWKRLRLESSATMKSNPETEYVSLLATTMALAELADAADVIGLALPGNVICFSDRIEGIVGINCDNPYAGLEDLIIWP
ncbi:MAG: hypothetical protein GX834_00525 [Clostridiaceae bacterium]|nr:hypothetical protein [Clostridiaceae bacterium]